MFGLTPYLTLLRSSTGQVQVKYRSSTGQVQVEVKQPKTVAIQGLSQPTQPPTQPITQPPDRLSRLSNPSVAEPVVNDEVVNTNPVQESSYSEEEIRDIATSPSPTYSQPDKIV